MPIEKSTLSKSKTLKSGELCSEKPDTGNTGSQINTPPIPTQGVQQDKQHPEFHLHLHFPPTVHLPLRLNIDKPFEVNIQISQVQSNIMSQEVISAGQKVTSTCAVQTNRASYVFFVRPDDQLGYMKGPAVIPDTRKAQSSPPFTVHSISYDSNAVKVNKASTQVAAVAYESQNGTIEIRLYYIDLKGHLAELCTTEIYEDNDVDFKPWKTGSLNKFGHAADPKTMLTATVDYHGSGQLKLYYQQNLNGFMYCTFVIKGTTAWSEDCIHDKWSF